MALKKGIYYYRSGPIERDPSAAFHSQNHLDKIFTEEFGFKIIGDTFEHLKAMGCPQEIYGPKMRKFRDQGEFVKYCENELLVTMSLRKVRQSDFMIIRPSAEGSGGTTSETVMGYLKGIPMLVIIGPHHEGISDNNSTFMIRMLNRRGLFFDTEKDVVDFVRKHIAIFKQGRRTIRRFIEKIKKQNPFINDRPKPRWDDRFEGKTVIILGWPGAGKGTQARRLQDLAGFKYFGSGHELRKLSNKLPKQGQSLGKGNLAKPVIIDYLLTHSLLRWERFEPVVIDGSPKMPEEAQALMDLFELLDRKPIVIVIDITEELSRERIVQRRNCGHCEISFCGSELIDGSSCPYCGAMLMVRPENADPEAINKIMNWYQTNVKKVIEFFESEGLVTHIDGNRGKEEIFEDILNILKK